MAGEFTGTPERISDRTEFIEQIADELFGSGIFDENRIFLRRNRLRLCAEAYFLLNEAYKKWRIIDGHNTELPKVAAMMCMVIVRIQPLRPIDLNNAVSRVEVQCNEIFALAVACASLGIDVDARRENFNFRLLDHLATSGSETIEPYIVDKNLSNNRALDTYKLNILPVDQDRTNGLITIFELLAHDLD